MNAGFVRGLDVANLIAHKKNVLGLEFVVFEDVPNDRAFSEKFGGTFDEFKNLDVILFEKCRDIRLGI